VDEDTGELKLREFKRQNIEPPYLEILRWRCDQKYGRKGPKRRPSSGLHINASVGGPAPPGSTHSASPYSSPTSAVEERGRSPHRLSQKSKGASPRAHIPSPLARVAEENPQPIKIHTDLNGVNGKNGAPIERLVSIDTPRPSEDLVGTPARKTSFGSDKENCEKAKQAVLRVQFKRLR